MAELTAAVHMTATTRNRARGCAVVYELGLSVSRYINIRYRGGEEANQTDVINSVDSTATLFPQSGTLIILILMRLVGRQIFVQFHLPFLPRPSPIHHPPPPRLAVTRGDESRRLICWVKHSLDL